MVSTSQVELLSKETQTKRAVCGSPPGSTLPLGTATLVVNYTLQVVVTHITSYESDFSNNYYTFCTVILQYAVLDCNQLSRVTHYVPLNPSVSLILINVTFSP